MADIEIREHSWSEESTWTLIYAWGRRYVELNGENLRQNDWQEVANAVNSRHGGDKVARRTDVQCKNQIETLKVKYTVEKTRIENSNGQFTSSWPFYSRLDHLITKKPSPKPLFVVMQPPPVVVEVEVEDDEVEVLGTSEGEKKRRLTRSTERFVEIYGRVGVERQKQMKQFAKRTASESDVMMTGEDKGTKREKLDELSIPPGFVSLRNFTLMRVERNDEASSSLAVGSDFEPELEKSLRHRPWILDKQLNNPGQSDTEHLAMNHPIRNSLPKGVIRGCSSCNDCQKVTASWRPDEPCIL